MDHLLSGLATRLGQGPFVADRTGSYHLRIDGQSVLLLRQGDDLLLESPLEHAPWTRSATSRGCCGRCCRGSPVGAGAIPRPSSWMRTGACCCRRGWGSMASIPSDSNGPWPPRWGCSRRWRRSWSRCPAGCRRRFRCGVPDAPPADRRTAGAAAWRGLARAAAGLAQPALRLCGAGRKPARRAGQLRRQLRCLGDRQRQGQRPGQRSLRPGKPAGLPAVDGLPLQPRLVLRRHRAVRIQDHRDAIAAGEAGAGRRGRA